MINKNSDIFDIIVYFIGLVAIISLDVAILILSLSNVGALILVALSSCSGIITFCYVWISHWTKQNEVQSTKIID